jgi:hypothetical protein
MAVQETGRSSVVAALASSLVATGPNRNVVTPFCGIRAAAPREFALRPVDAPPKRPPPGRDGECGHIPSALSGRPRNVVTPPPSSPADVVTPRGAPGSRVRRVETML